MAPTYSYLNTETGEEWEEIRPMSNRLDGVDGVKIVQTLRPSKGGYLNHEKAEKLKKLDHFHRDVLGPKCEQWRPDRKFTTSF